MYKLASNNSEAVRAGKTCLLFTASWCGACKMLHASFKIMAGKLRQEGIDVYETDAEAFPDLAKEYKIKALPTMVCLKDGEVLGSLYGAGGIKEAGIREYYAD